MKVGLGIITAGVREIPSQAFRNTSTDTMIHIEVDINRNGPAITRNKCIKKLVDEGCDYICMLDDDCYPLKKGWENYLISEMQRTGVHFFALPYLFESEFSYNPNTKLVKFDKVIGCMSFFDMTALNTVGYYNTKYHKYGYEDVGRNSRMIRSGMTYQQGSAEGFETPLYLSNYFMSEDIYHIVKIHNMSQDEKNKYIEMNREEWQREMSGPIYYDYTGDKE